MSEAIAAIATGAQVSAIGIIRLSGDGVIAMVDRLFRPSGGSSMCQSEDRRLVYGKLYSLNGELLDICMCTVSHSPHSYTGEDTAELQCHGSPVVLREALEQLFRLGARQALPGEFTKRAFLNGRMDLSAAEAVADIIDARSVESALNAAGQLSGAVSRKTSAIYTRLADISSHYHAVLDYPDEDIDEFSLAAYKKDIRDAQNALTALLASFDRGKLMNSGIPTAIVGRPNAGKSSLLNALLGYDRAIVTGIPGTTRDTIEETLRLGGVCLRLMDTAGIRETGDELERLGVERSRQALKGAQLVLAVVDGSEEYTTEDAQIIKAAEKAPNALVVLSKNDLEQSVCGLDTVLTTVSVSSVTGEGIAQLESAIAALFPLPEVPAGEILTNSRQADAIGRALDYLKAALDAMKAGYTPDIVLTETEGAMAALGELDGRCVREDVTARIFHRFCVGK